MIGCRWFALMAIFVVDFEVGDGSFSATSSTDVAIVSNAYGAGSAGNARNYTGPSASQTFVLAHRISVW